MLAVRAVIGFIGALCLPFLHASWVLMALTLLFWGGSVSGLYTVGLAHLGARLKGSDLANANAAFVFCYAVGTVAGPQGIGTAMDISGNHGFAYAIALFFALYLVVSVVRLFFRPKRA